MSSIFVMIAAYRDPEISWTINDAIAKASNPERLSFGVCWQGNQEDEQWVEGLQFIPRCHIVSVKASESGGCCWARAKTQELWQGEEHALQIDSHSRFVQDWDAKLLAMLDACKSPKPVLTAYPASYTFPSELDPSAKPYRIGANYFTQYGVLIAQAIAEIDSSSPAPGYFLSAGIVFGSSDWIQEIPYDEHLYFDGEEPSLAMRLWTNGWDVYHPNKVTIHHNYNRQNAPRHQNEYTNIGRELKSYSRFRAVMIGEDFGKYGAGNVRSLDEYQRLCGVDFKAQTIKDFAKVGVFNG